MLWSKAYLIIAASVGSPTTVPSLSTRESLAYVIERINVESVFNSSAASNNAPSR